MLLRSTMSTALQLYVSMRLHVNMKVVSYAMVLAGKLIAPNSIGCTLQVRSMASDRGLTAVAPQVVSSSSSSSSSSSDVTDVKAAAALDYMQFSYTADDA
jgi:hypothetical protein